MHGDTRRTPDSNPPPDQPLRLTHAVLNCHDIAHTQVFFEQALGFVLTETMPCISMEGWQAVVAPTGTPAVAIERFNRDMNQLLNDKQVDERIGAIGPIVDGSMNVNAVAAFLRDDSTRWKAITQEIGVLPE